MWTTGPAAIACAEPRSVITERKKDLGAFYTPAHLAQVIADWAIRSPSDRALDPAAGEAVFLLAAVRRVQELSATPGTDQIVGVEVDPEAHAQVTTLVAGWPVQPRFELADFFTLTPERLGMFEAVIGNPPYVRYHRFRGASRNRALAASMAAGVRLNGLASSWAPFLVHATRFLGPSGRLGLVLPAELLHVDYAAPVREFLLRRFGAVTVITFERAVFPGALIDTVLLLAENESQRRGLRIVCLDDATSLSPVLGGLFSREPVDRWTELRAPGDGVEVLHALAAAQKANPLSAIASVDIGCVTGANSFFVLTPGEARTFGLGRDLLKPVIARPAQLRGAIVRLEPQEAFGDDEKWLLLHPRRDQTERSAPGFLRYLEHGQRLGIDQRYKCRVRRPWYRVPGVRVPDAFLSYMAHKAPRVALNAGGFTSTNLVHQIAFHLDAWSQGAAYVASLYSSISLLSFELEGRSYGGGVLKLETREAERVRVPVLSDALAATLSALLPRIDEAVRAGAPDEATNLVDRVLIEEGVLRPSDLLAIQKTRTGLQARRWLRGRSSASCP